MAEMPKLEEASSVAAVSALSTQYPPALIGVPLEPVRLTWAATADQGDQEQLGYQIAWRSGPADWQEAAAVAGADSIGVLAPGGALKSRECRQYRVRIAHSTGWSPWSAAVQVEAGLAAADWQAQLISIPSEFEGPTPMLRREFELPGVVKKARVYASGQGFYELWLNGRRTDAEYMNPGWTVYSQRILVQTWDVTELLTPGVNCLGLVLGDGWFRGLLGGAGRHDTYGSQLAGLAQLEITLASGEKRTLATDGTWRGGFGALTSTSIYDGCAIDARLCGKEFSLAGFDDSAWQPVEVLDTDHHRFVPRSAPGIKAIAEFPMKITRLADRVLLDSGQNLAGLVRLTVRGKAGDTIWIRHAEVLNPDGSLHTRSLRRAKPIDRYVLGHDGESVLEPVHTYHGFRYCDVTGEAEVLAATAVAISADLPTRASFASSHSGLNQFHSNAYWSLRSNFMSVPTDCPQRDERLGWTGDAAAFSAAANTLVELAPFWAEWLKDLALEQREDGSVPSTVPNVFELGELVMDGVIADPWGRSGWADAVTLIPAACYEAYGDQAILMENLEPMRRWVEHLRQRAGDALVLPAEPFQWGDWLDPDAPGGRPWESKVTPQFVANAFYIHSLRLLAAAEKLVGSAAAAEDYLQLSDTVAAEAWRYWREDAYRTQTGAALALEYGIAPEAERAQVAAALADSVREHDGRIAVGFVGARLILFALAHSGYLSQAYQMLLRHEPPSWLYQVDQGATTVWERWDALKPDGSIHTGTMDTVSDDVMVSFNHYAYGAMVDWLYRFAAGLEPCWDAPGYRKARVQPRPTAELSWAKAAIQTSFGEWSIDWRLLPNGDLSIKLTVPFGAQAELNLPLTAESQVRLGDSPAPATLEAGVHYLTVTRPAIA